MMKQYTIEAPDGRQVTIEGDREPTEADMQEIFSTLPQPNQVVQDPTLPNSAEVDQNVAGREDILSRLMQDAPKQAALVANPVDTGKNLLNAIGGSAQRLEAGLANPAGEMQKGNFNPPSLLDSMVKGLEGKVLGQFGDLVRRTGVGGDYNEALASTTGFMAALSIPDLLNKGKATKSLQNKAMVIGSDVNQAVTDAVRNRTGFLEDMRSAFYDAKSTAVEKYGMGLDDLAKNNPNTPVDLKPAIDYLNQAVAYEPKLRNAINRIPQLVNLMDNPSSASKMGIKEVQSIVNDLQSKVSSGKLKGIGVRPDDIPLLDAIHDIKAQMVQAFPDLADLRKDYGEVLNNFNLVRSKFTPRSLEGSIKNNFGGVEMEKAAKTLLKDSPEILARMKNYNLIRKVGKVALIGTEGVAGAVLLKKFLNS